MRNISNKQKEWCAIQKSMLPRNEREKLSQSLDGDWYRYRIVPIVVSMGAVHLEKYCINLISCYRNDKQVQK